MSLLHASDLMNGEGTAQDASIILNCPHCNWSSLEVGIRFERPGGIFYALSRMKDGGGYRQTRRELERELDRRRREEERGDNFSTSRKIQDIEQDLKQHTPDLDELFLNMRSFYSAHSAEVSSTTAYNTHEGVSYGSPGGLNRLMGLYPGGGYTSRKDTSKPVVAREAHGALEGMNLFGDETDVIEKLQHASWEGSKITTSFESIN
jgi:dynactin-4